MKNLNLKPLVAVLFLAVAALFVTRLHSAPNYTGPNPVPDAFNNVAIGNPGWFPVSTCTGVIAIGTNAGSISATNGCTNGIFIGNAGTAGDAAVVRIGTPGTHTNVYLSGVVTSTPLTNVTTIAQGSTGYTNNTTADVFVYIYPTNYAFTVYAGAQGTNAIIVAGAVGTPGPFTFHLPPNWCIVGTNISGKVVNSL